MNRRRIAILALAVLALASALLLRAAPMGPIATVTDGLPNAGAPEAAPTGPTPAIPAGGAVGQPKSAAPRAAARTLSTTASYYMNTVDPTRLISLGRAAGDRTLGLPDPQDDLIILMFGAPMERGGIEGTNLYRGKPAGPDFASGTQIAWASEDFITGYLGRSDPRARLRLVIGTSNFGRNATRDHGTAWGRVVSDVSEWIAFSGMADRVGAFGGSDIEVDWSKPQTARQWVDGYLSATKQLLYDFGDAGGCPRTDSQNGGCNNGWTQEDVWYVAWGSGGRQPMPQIYNPTFAGQWYQLKRYSLAKMALGYQPMEIAGVLTEDGACRQNGGCPKGFGFTPMEGWTALTKLLNGNPGTAQELRYSSDIKWLP